MYLEKFLYKILKYDLIEVSHLNNVNANIITLHIEYSYKMDISNLNSYDRVTLVFGFDSLERLYKLLAQTEKKHVNLESVLVEDNLLIKRNNNYYLAESALLRLF